MEDLKKIYRLKRYFPNFDNPVQQAKEKYYDIWLNIFSLLIIVN